MRQFAATVSRFDVYIAPYMPVRSTGSATVPAPTPAPPPNQQPSAIRDHFQVANVCGYPAVSIPSGFTADGKPTSITFLGRLYNEAQVLALAKAYQDRAGWHRTTPKLTKTTSYWVEVESDCGMKESTTAVVTVATSSKRRAARR